MSTYKLEISQEALEDLIYWAKKKPRITVRIYELITEIVKTPFEGKGKPEALKYDYSGCWSRRIDEVNRLVYKVEKNQVLVLACRYHY